jgi:hypothetical protein
MTGGDMSKSAATDSTELCNSILLNTARQSRWKQRVTSRNGSANCSQSVILSCLRDDVLNSYARGAHAVHSAQCAMCAAVPCTGWNGPACSWWGEGRIGNWRGRRTDSERDRLSACYGIVGGAGSTQPVRTLAQCTARVQESSALLSYALLSNDAVIKL